MNGRPSSNGRLFLLAKVGTNANKCLLAKVGIGLAKVGIGRNRETLDI